GNAPSNLSGSTPVDSGPSFAADTYTLAESGGPSGYTAGAWSCDGGTLDGNKVTVGLGQSATCTINNNDNAPALHLRKTVVNDNGGTALATAWTLTATGTGNAPSNLSGSTPVDSGPSFNADTYTLAESGGPSGYTPGAWSCDGGTLDGNKVTVGLGQSATCTINNNDNAPSLHLRKSVVNDNGGTAAATDWTLTATGTGNAPTNLSGSTPVDSGPSFNADTYTLAESGGPSGYTAGAWSCDGGSLDGNKVTIGLGQSATCTIVNNDNAPSLHLRKTVVNDNGGTAAATDWTLTATGTGNAPTNLSGTTAVASSGSFNADTYTLAESGPSGYAAGSWNCVSGAEAPVPVTN